MGQLSGANVELARSNCTLRSEKSRRDAKLAMPWASAWAWNAKRERHDTTNTHIAYEYNEEHEDIERVQFSSVAGARKFSLGKIQI